MSAQAVLDVWLVLTALDTTTAGVSSVALTHGRLLRWPSSKP